MLHHSSYYLSLYNTTYHCTILLITVQYTIHCTVHESLYNTRVTVLYTSHCTIHELLYNTRVTVQYTSHCTIHEYKSFELKKGDILHTFSLYIIYLIVENSIKLDIKQTIVLDCLYIYGTILSMYIK